MTRDGHVGDILDQLVKDCAEVVEASAAALLVTDQDDRLSLLAVAQQPMGLGDRP